MDARSETKGLDLLTAEGRGHRDVEALTVEVVWFDSEVSAHLPKGEAPAAVARPEGDANGAGKGEGKAEAAPDLLLRVRVRDVLSRGAPVSAGHLEAALEAIEDAAAPSPAVVLVSGTLELCLDDIEMLEATVAAATPLASSDKKLKEVIDVASEMLRTPMLAMPDLAQGLAARVRDAWGKVNRALPADHLTTCAERLLLERRSYQKRELLDDTWLRALLLSPGDGPAVPVYLPARIAKRLPLYRRFSARVIGEIVWQQDQYETCPVAVRALALGRLPARSRARAPRR